MSRFVAVGSGSEGLQLPEVCDAIVGLTQKAAADITVAYVGTATYNLGKPRENQTKRLAELGCKISDVVVKPECACDAASKFAEADVIVVSGGNTLYAIDMWENHGIKPMMREAMDRGCVMAGGSAGAICWFEGGHSDSADPDSFKASMEAEYSGTEVPTDESSGLVEGDEAKKWEYIRVPCLGFLPGLVCPHADKIQSNGVLRAKDFDQMMNRHVGERGFCIDHYAALIIDGENYRVLSVPGMPGSVLEESASFSEEREGKPGIWIKDVLADGKIKTTLMPSQGKVKDILKEASDIKQDPRLKAVRNANPFTQPV